MVIALGCSTQSTEKNAVGLTGDTWGEKLGFPKDKRVLILHADDVGMCPEANQAAARYLQDGHIQSASCMVPCPSFDDFTEWYKSNADADVGLHLTLTSEWKTHRWSSVAPASEVPGLQDPDGMLWHNVPQVVQNATPDEIEREIRAQIEYAHSLGIEPGHIDTHMGTLYGHAAFTERYLSVAMEYGIPAMAIEFTDPVVARFREQGYPIDENMVDLGSSYSLPKLDDFYSAPHAQTYEGKKQVFRDLVQSLNPGITEIIFHPSVESDSLKKITNSWQQRVWEAQMFSDPEMIQFFVDEGILFTNWKDMMNRFQQRTGG
jgi:predicted glycoside hydrolase/deacetylase ChbG (UPF0249 family)